MEADKACGRMKEILIYVIEEGGNGKGARGRQRAVDAGFAHVGQNGDDFAQKYIDWSRPLQRMADRLL